LLIEPEACRCSPLITQATDFQAFGEKGILADRIHSLHIGMAFKTRPLSAKIGKHHGFGKRRDLGTSTSTATAASSATNGDIRVGTAAGRELVFRDNKEDSLVLDDDDVDTDDSD
jgi:hypothetical protein